MQPSQYRYTQLQYIFAVISEAPSIISQSKMVSLRQEEKILDFNLFMYVGIVTYEFYGGVQCYVLKVGLYPTLKVDATFLLLCSKFDQS